MTLNAKEKLHNLIVGDYAYWRTAIQRAINTGELRKDVDVEDAVVMFRQVYMGLSFEMSFLGGLDTERLAKHLRSRLLLIEMLDRCRPAHIPYLLVCWCKKI